MKKEKRIFISIFALTMLLLVLISGTTILIFARQFLSFYEHDEMKWTQSLFQPVLDEFIGQTPEEIETAARSFYEKNQNLSFMIEDTTGKIIFSTPGAPYEMLRRDREAGRLRLIMRNPSGDSGYTLFGINKRPQVRDYGSLFQKSVLAFFVILIIGSLWALLFAHKVAKPLIDEVRRRKKDEENQRNFFQAASHELKTPIAQASALIEGMLANIGDYKDHPRYLRECLQTLDAQNRLVSEILEIVKLGDGSPDDSCGNTAGDTAGGTAGGAASAPFFENVDLSELLDSLLGEYRGLASLNGQSIVCDTPSVTVKAERNMLRRALSNILSNAVQNTSSPGEIRIYGGEAGGAFTLNIYNAKAHIDESAADKLFEPFYRADAARTARSGRSGLGLTIVKKLLDRMNIPFSLENSGEGVLFSAALDLNPGATPATSGKIQTNYRNTTD